MVEFGTMTLLFFKIKVVKNYENEIIVPTYNGCWFNGD